MPLGPLPGFRDFYPTEYAERSYLFDTWRDVARRFGFVEYDGPPLESLELYTRKSGDEIVGQLYNFMDKGGREVALRPEMTPTLARMVSARANALRKPVRWFSIPQLFRYERQQRGRLREHFQLNLDIIGEADVTADAELLAAVIEVLRALRLGPGDVRARVSDRRLLQGLLQHAGVDESQLPAVYAVVDKIERDPRPALEKRLVQVGLASGVIDRIFDLVAERDLDSLRGRYGDVPALREVFSRIERYLQLLRALAVDNWVVFDLSVVRGLAYYTGIVFEVFDVKGELRAVCGGGRYDSLLKSLGGVDLPALGVGMGDVVLSELLRDRGLMPGFAPALDFWVAAEGDGDLVPEVMRVATALRRAGKRVEYALRKQSPDKQRKAARSAGAARIVTVDAALLDRGSVRLQWADAERARASGEGPEGQSIALDSLLDQLAEPAPAADGLLP